MKNKKLCVDLLLLVQRLVKLFDNFIFYFFIIVNFLRMNEISNFYLLCFVNLFVKILEHNDVWSISWFNDILFRSFIEKCRIQYSILIVTTEICFAIQCFNLKALFDCESYYILRNLWSSFLSSFFYGFYWSKYSTCKLILNRCSREWYSLLHFSSGLIL